MGDPKLNKWLRLVDDQLVKEPFEFLKLGLHSELRRYSFRVDKLNRPTELFHFLLEHRGKQSESEVLKMFIHVLKGLGGKLRGNLVLRYGFGENGLEDPGDFDIQNASSEFKFFQCLLQILKKIMKDSELSQIVKDTLCRRLKMNPDNFKYLPKLFITLYQEQVISAGDTDLLKEVLSRYETSNKEIICECLEILESHSIGIALIPLEEIARGSSGNEPLLLWDVSNCSLFLQSLLIVYPVILHQLVSCCNSHCLILLPMPYSY